jgi:hypothetical protein
MRAPSGYRFGMFVIAILLVFLAGYVTQRGSVCAVAATWELVVERKASRYVGFLFCAACGLLVMAVGNAFGRPVFDSYPGLPVSVAALVGGAIVGIGAYINRRCAFGTVAELGTGRLPRIATLIGFIAGTSLGDLAHMGLAGMPQVSSPLVALPASTALAIAVVAMALLGLALTQLARPRPAPDWTPLQAMAVIGLSNGLLLVLAHGWPYTSVLMQIARGAHDAIGPHALMAIAFVLGSVAGGVALGHFHLSLGSARDWLRAFGGGAIMGVGAVLVPGGNDAMLLVGVPLLLPNLLAAYAAMSLMLVVLVAIRARSAEIRQKRSDL